MRILKMKIPSKTIVDLGLPNYFEVISRMEILQIFEYDTQNFFAMYSIQFKERIIDNLAKYLQEKFFAQSYKILERKRKEILCIMKQQYQSGFWPAFLSNSCALIPPLVFDPDAIIFGVIAKEDKQLNTVIKDLKIFKNLQILSVGDVDESISNSMVVIPRLTSRQKEIMTYATRHGYFEVPKQISTEHLANHFGVSTSAILNHIQKSERSIMKNLFG